MQKTVHLTVKKKLKKNRGGRIGAKVLKHRFANLMDVEKSKT